MDSLRINRRFEQVYHFGDAQDECYDFIAVTFDQANCEFILFIRNSYFYDGWCQESEVMYDFKLDSNRILEFARYESG